MTLNNWAEQAIAQMDETHRQNYREVYNAAWKKPLGSRRLQSLTAQEIQAAADAMLAAGKSAKTVRNAWSVLAVLLDKAIREGHLRCNVARAVMLPPAAPARAPAAPAMTAEQRRRIVTAALQSPHPYAGGIVLANQMGLTCSEICALTYGDVSAHAVTVHRMMCRAESGWRVKETPPRTIHLRPKSRAVLEGQRVRFYDAAGRMPAESDPVIFRADGAPLNPDNLRQFFVRLAAKCGMEQPRFEQLKGRQAL